jgi:uncharacterized protein (TIGR02466 family)
MQIAPLFPVAVGKFNLGRAFTTEEFFFVDNQPVHNNMGNTTSDNHYVFKDEALADLNGFVESSLDEYFKTIYAPKHEVKLRITQSWLNYTKEGQFHHKHAHPNSLISGVFYLKADATKDKIYFFKDGYQQIKLPTEQFNLYNSDSWWISVAAGDLVLFPSSLTHMVETVQGDERISLAFNTFPVGYVGEEKELTALHV